MTPKPSLKKGRKHRHRYTRVVIGFPGTKHGNPIDLYCNKCPKRKPSTKKSRKLA